MKKLLIWLLVLGGAAGGWWWWKSRQAAAEDSALDDLVPEVVQVERGDLRVIVQATGKIVPNATVEIKSKASGEILRLPFEEGDEVHAGDLLMELDPSDEQRNVQRADSNLSSAQARLTQAQNQLRLMESDAGRIQIEAESRLREAPAQFDDAQARFDRREGLHQEGVLNEEELDAARTALEQATAALSNARAAYEDAQNYPLNIELRRQDVVLAETTVHEAEIQLEEAEERFEDTRIVSPADGVITALTVEVGQIIASGISNVGGGTALMTISDLSRIFVEVKVDETDIGEVATSQECLITADAFSGATFAGRVDRIAPQGLEEQNIITFEVRVEVSQDASPEQELVQGGEDMGASEAADRKEVQLLPNMTANVEIITHDLHDVLLLPNEAIQRDEQGRPFIQIASAQASGEMTPRPGMLTGSDRDSDSGAWRGSGDDSRRGWRNGTGDSDSRGPRAGGRRARGGGASSEVGEDSAEPEEVPADRRYVVLGPSDGIHTQIVGGVSEGDDILIPVPDWLIRFRSDGPAELDERARRRARMMM